MAAAAAVVAAALTAALLQAQATPSNDSQGQRITERIRALQREADRLAGEARTLVGDLRKLKIRYCIRKNTRSTTRQARQQVFAAQAMDALRSTYFDGEPAESFAALHRGMER